ncbi:MAG: TetR/AcrR family transcriptional regulator [Xanthobacteraceae bacterium]|nr:TetR/AcrR family transcriptional regulator [Xanthobacteraceae bacterium]
MSTPAPTPSPARWEPTPRWERRYREVLDVAATIFAEKTYAGASTRDIAERLGVRQASLYYYFPSKEAALAAICEHGVKDFISNLQSIIAEPVNAADKLRAAIANHLAPLRRHPDADYVCVFIRHRRELPNGPRQAIAALAHTYQDLIERLFADGIATRQFRADLDPKLATLAFLGLCNSVITSRGVPRSSTIDAMIEEYARIVTGGVVAGERAAKPKRRSR